MQNVDHWTWHSKIVLILVLVINITSIFQRRAGERGRLEGRAKEFLKYLNILRVSPLNPYDIRD